MSLRSLLLLAVCSLGAASEWSFTGGKATLARRGDPEGSSLSFGPNKPIPSAIPLAARDILKLQFTLTDGKNTGRPHQALLLVTDPETDLETFYPLSVKESSGRAKVDLTHKDIPSHLLSSSTLSLSLALGDNASPSGSIILLGSIVPTIDPSTKTALEKQREKDLGEGTGAFGPKREIFHVFREDAKSPPKIITLAFLASVVVAYLGLFGAWFQLLGANFCHLPKALQAAPVSHSLFFVSLVALEGLFFLYYTSWNLFQLLGGVSIVGFTAFLSGSRALREVRARRERGER